MDRRRRARVGGRVQGVGFRPHVHRLATRFGLGGAVWNDCAGVAIEVEGDERDLAAFADALVTEPLPSLARIDIIDWCDVAVQRGGAFRIADPDGASVGARLDGLADVGPCAACIAEFDDSADRRWRYPFTCCTDCGPRLTIATAGPWARTNTVMDQFTMCEACRAEFESPADRRFHAETIACPTCGPTLVHVGAEGTTSGVAAIDRLIRDVAAGGVALVKGVGGHHLIGRADRADVVAVIRRIKQRDAKPMAVLVAEIDVARRLAVIDDATAAVLDGPGRPIVLAPRRGDAVAGGVADGVGDLGVVVAPSLLHLELARRVGVPLVFTSANPSGAPTVVADRDAATLAEHPDIACSVTHDRPITTRADDTVLRTMRGRRLIVRSGRGDAVVVRRLPAPVDRVILGVGGHLKNTVSMAVGDHVHTSAHIGDLDHPGARHAWEQAIDQLVASVGAKPELVVTDRHPDYASTVWAADLGADIRTVQHHHAHAAAALVEHRRRGPVVAIVLDGHGLGDDGTSWGGEVLVVDDGRCHRAAHLRSVALPGGTAAIRDPWRMAVAWLADNDDDAAAREVAARWGGDGVDVLEVCRWATSTGATTSSAGRLIDALAAIVGLAGNNRFEGDAAMSFEALAASCDRAPRLYEIECHDAVVDARELVARVRADLASGADRCAVARGALLAIADGFARAACGVAKASGISTVVLSGGVVQNRIIDGELRSRLTRAGLDVLAHASVPANDGGLSVGQVLIGAQLA